MVAPRQSVELGENLYGERAFADTGDFRVVRIAQEDKLRGPDAIRGVILSEQSAKDLRDWLIVILG